MDWTVKVFVDQISVLCLVISGIDVVLVVINLQVIFFAALSHSINNVYYGGCL